MFSEEDAFSGSEGSDHDLGWSEKDMSLGDEAVVSRCSSPCIAYYGLWAIGDTTWSILYYRPMVLLMDG